MVVAGMEKFLNNSECVIRKIDNIVICDTCRLDNVVSFFIIRTIPVWNHSECLRGLRHRVNERHDEQSTTHDRHHKTVVEFFSNSNNRQQDKKGNRQKIVRGKTTFCCLINNLTLVLK